MSEPTEDRVTLLMRFADAWGRRDLDGVMALMTDDCIYEASIGPGPGAVYAGRDAVLAGISAMFAHDDGSRSEVSGVFVAGDRGAWEWTYTWPGPGGRTVRGCDLFEFEGDLIHRKNAFRKTLE